MKVSVFGLGYVGTVSIACLLHDGHSVIGVDPNQTKVDQLSKGCSPIVEEGVNDLLEKGKSSHNLMAGTDSIKAVLESDLIFICVGTPSQKNGNLDLKFVQQVMEQIGTALQEKSEFCVIVLRSTVLPGTTRNLVIPLLEKVSGKRAGHDFGVCFNPEFLREGTAVDDYWNPPKIVVASTDKRSQQLLAQLNQRINASEFNVSFEAAEMVKYVDNAWHAVKVSFANEVGVLSKAQGVDGHTVMDIFCQDKKLNLSEKYLKPGFAFGGSCLPKDLRALNYQSRSLDLELPVLTSVLTSNKAHIERGFQMITNIGRRRIGILGLSFKAGTDDLRESPMVEVVERLIGKGYEVRIFDSNVNVANLIGANRDFINTHIPHFPKLLMEKLTDVVDFGETIVIGNSSASFKDMVAVAQRQDKVVIDLVRIIDNEATQKGYHGICW